MEFNQQQQTAIRSDSQNLLVLAGAGTGKTRTIIGRARHLLSKGVDPKRLVIVTFTRRSAREIQGRLSLGSGSPASGVITGTFHHFCLRVMSARRRWFGFEDLTVMDRDDQVHLMKLVRGETVGRNSSIPQSAQLLSYYSYARNTNQSPQTYLEKFAELDPGSTETVLKIFAAYKKRKLTNSYLDYDDILHRFAKVLHDDDDVCRKVAGQYEHVLVDEMQDTNPLQWIILERLAEHAKLFCVGDDAQSIYAFRGADFRNVHSFQSRLKNAETLKLEENYRSTQEILDLANWLLDQSSLEYGKMLHAHRGDGMMPQLMEFETEFEEAAWVTEAIKRRHSEGGAWSDHMVLCRTAYTARPVEAQLIENKIPYRFVGGTSLLQMAHVRDLLSALRVVVNCKDEIAWMRYLTLWPGIGEVTASRAVKQVSVCNSLDKVAEVVDALPRNRKEVAQALRDVQSHLEDPSNAIKHLTKTLESVLESKYDRWESRKKDLELLQRLATRHRSVQTFLEAYTLDPVSATEASSSSGDDIVTLITVHSAKGTEAKVCFVVAAQPGNYPHSRSVGDKDAVEEERRVLYVALTRAQDELLVSRSLARSYSRVSWNDAAGSEYFLSNMPSKLVETKSLYETMQPFSLEEDVIGDDVIG